MGKEERKQKIEELSKKMKEVNSKIKEGTDKVIFAGMEAKDVLDEKMKEKLSKYIDDVLEYADHSIALAFLAVEEAKVAFLNAVEAQQEYDEKYGDDE